MANLEHINFGPWREFPVGTTFSWETDPTTAQITGLPQIFWENGESWAEVNIWAINKLDTQKCHIETAKALMQHLLSYACYLEDKLLDWRHFPIRSSKRAIVLFRGHLINQIKIGALAPSTARARMSAVVQFYRFSESQSFISPSNPMWREKSVVVKYYDSAGFQRAISRASTDLAIPNRSIAGIRLEDGLTPLSNNHMDELLSFIAKNETHELHLLLMIGFFTGARLCTISTLRIEDLENATPDPYMENIYLIRVGPGTTVKTKFDVEGDLLVPQNLLKELKSYAYSTERLKREAKALHANKSTLFLTTHGKPYNRNTVGVLMSSLRKRALLANLNYMKNFKFHQTRATYGTWMMKLSLGVTSTGAAIEFVKSAMHHKHESTTFRYVKFLESTKGKQEAAKAFNEAFTGLERRNWDDFQA
ncbi:Phage integrase family protein [compost metagenome]